MPSFLYTKLLHPRYAQVEQWRPGLLKFSQDGTKIIVKLNGSVDEVLEHRLGVGEVGDHAVLHRAHRGDVARRAAEHLLGLGADRGDRTIAAADAVVAHRDHGRLVEHDALPAGIDQGIGGPQVDGQVIGEESAQTSEEHCACRSPVEKARHGINGLVAGQGESGAGVWAGAGIRATVRRPFHRAAP